MRARQGQVDDQEEEVVTWRGAPDKMSHRSMTVALSALVPPCAAAVQWRR